MQQIRAEKSKLLDNELNKVLNSDLVNPATARLIGEIIGKRDVVRNEFYRDDYNQRIEMNAENYHKAEQIRQSEIDSEMKYRAFKNNGGTFAYVPQMAMPAPPPNTESSEVDNSSSASSSSLPSSSSVDSLRDIGQSTINTSRPKPRRGRPPGSRNNFNQKTGCVNNKTATAAEEVKRQKKKDLQQTQPLSQESQMRSIHGSSSASSSSSLNHSLSHSSTSQILAPLIMAGTLPGPSSSLISHLSGSPPQGLQMNSIVPFGMNGMLPDHIMRQIMQTAVVVEEEPLQLDGLPAGVPQTIQREVPVLNFDVLKAMRNNPSSLPPNTDRNQLDNAYNLIKGAIHQEVQRQHQL